MVFLQCSFLNSIKPPFSLLMQISTRYLQFRQSAGIGKLYAHFALPIDWAFALWTSSSW